MVEMTATCVNLRGLFVVRIREGMGIGNGFVYSSVRSLFHKTPCIFTLMLNISKLT